MKYEFISRLNSIETLLDTNIVVFQCIFLLKDLFVFVRLKLYTAAFETNRRHPRCTCECVWAGCVFEFARRDEERQGVIRVATIFIIIICIIFFEGTMYDCCCCGCF